MKKHLPLRIVCAFICAYCVLLGLCLNSGDAMVGHIAQRFLEYQIPPDSPLVLAAGLAGAYMVFFGCCMGLVAWRPMQNRALLSIAVVFLFIRALQRIVNFQTLQETFGLTSGKNTTYIVIVLALAVLLLVFRLSLLREMKSSASA